MKLQKLTSMPSSMHDEPEITNAPENARGITAELFMERVYVLIILECMAMVMKGNLVIQHLAAHYELFFCGKRFMIGFNHFSCNDGKQQAVCFFPSHISSRITLAHIEGRLDWWAVLG